MRIAKPILSLLLHEKYQFLHISFENRFVTLHTKIY